MAVKFNRLVGHYRTDSRDQSDATRFVRTKSDSDTMIFMSHKTGDYRAAREAEYIAQRHGMKVYMAEWDDHVDHDSKDLPDYIMDAIRKSNGFLVNVIAEIVVSMWIGYEIGGAHAMRMSRAKIMYDPIRRLPSVVAALESLRDRPALDLWIRANIRSYRAR